MPSLTNATIRQALKRVELTGPSARDLKYMRAFAEAWPDAEFVQQVVALLPWATADVTD